MSWQEYWFALVSVTDSSFSDMLTIEASNAIRNPGKPRLRKIALTHQGLSSAKPFGSGVAAVAKAVEHLGYVQIDTISVVERAHHLSLIHI